MVSQKFGLLTATSSRKIVHRCYSLLLRQDIKYRTAGTIYINPIEANQFGVSRIMIGIRIKGIEKISMIVAPTRGFLLATNLAIRRGPPMTNPNDSRYIKASPISDQVKPRGE